MIKKGFIQSLRTSRNFI